jgi:hypothetical protein
MYLGLVVVSYQIATEKIGKSELQGTTKFVTAQRVLDMFHPARVSSLIHHPSLNATSGSTFAARRAGNQHAIRATSVRSATITVNVNGSLAVTP